MSTPASIGGYAAGTVLIVAGVAGLLWVAYRRPKTSPIPSDAAARFTPGRVAAGVPGLTPAGRVTGRAPVPPRTVPGPQTAPASGECAGAWVGGAVEEQHRRTPTKWTARAVVDGAGLKELPPEMESPHAEAV